MLLIKKKKTFPEATFCTILLKQDTFAKVMISLSRMRKIRQEFLPIVGAVSIWRFHSSWQMLVSENLILKTLMYVTYVCDSFHCYSWGIYMVLI